MSDLISRQAVIDRINRLIEVEKKQGTDDWGYGQERVNSYESMLHMVESEYLYPSVEPERKPGKWVHMVGWWECNQCHAEYTDMPTCMGKVVYEYCPMCGAKMEVET